MEIYEIAFCTDGFAPDKVDDSVFKTEFYDKTLMHFVAECKEELHAEREKSLT